MIGSRITGAVAALVLSVGIGGMAPQAHAGPQACTTGDPLHPEAEIFATDNTAVITDPNDARLQDRLGAFELQVDAVALQDLALPVGSTLLDGVFWSPERQQATYERSREFRLACLESSDLHRIADHVRARFHQEAVLTFEPLPADSPARNAFTIEAPNVDTARFRDALLADPNVRTHLTGGSITEDHTLVLVADLADLDLTRNFLTNLGATWDPTAVRYGDREFVD